MSDLQEDIAWYLAREDFPELTRLKDNFHAMGTKATTTPYPERARAIARIIAGSIYDWEKEE